MSQPSPKSDERSLGKPPQTPAEIPDADENIFYRISIYFPQIIAILAVLLICVVPSLNISIFLDKKLLKINVTQTATTAPEGVDIPIAKSQISTAGQPLTSNQWIQVSVYVPNSDGTDLEAKASTAARFVFENDTHVILSVPQDQAGSLEKALLNENAKLTYHKIAPPVATATEEPMPTATFSTIPTPAPGAVQLKISVEKLQGGIASLSEKTKVRLIIVEPVAVFYGATQPVATYEPELPTHVCASVKGFMVADKDGLVSKDAATPAYVLVEISAQHAPDIARALTNAASVYLMPVQDCSLGS